MFQISPVQILFFVENSTEIILRIISKPFAVGEASHQKIPVGDLLTWLFLRRKKVKLAK